MNTYIALLRGINVSGQKKIIMADLRVLLEKLGFIDVSTYIQSGNIVLKSEEKSTDKIERTIADGIRKAYDFDVAVMVRKPDIFEHVLKTNPFVLEQDKDIKRVYVSFLSTEPDNELVNKIERDKFLPEEFIIDGAIIYGYSPEGLGNAKMNNNFYEQKLKVSATTRNWNTVNVLFDMASA